jgi:hypothetical protein
MENKIVSEPNGINKIKNLVIRYKKLLLILLTIILVSVIGSIFFNYNQENKSKIISENYVKAGIFLSNNNKEKSKNIYKQIILSKNKFYSPLALNNILENNLEIKNNEVLKFFEVVESIKLPNEQKNLIKIKKALYLIKISRPEVGNKLLEEIILSNSVWSNMASEILNSKK